MPKLSAKSVDYMELTGAKKDADCSRVEVQGGVSKERGCCNDFEHEKGKSLEFRCGTCEYLISEGKDYFFGG